MLASPGGMAAPHGNHRLRYADLAHLPDDGVRHELYDGAILTVSPSTARHDAVVRAMARGLRRYARQHGGRVLQAPFDLVLSTHDVLQPDVAFFHASRSALVHGGPPVRHPPDVVVEVLDLATAAIDRGPKMRTLARHGVLEYWLADPRHATIDVQVLRDGQYELFQRAGHDDHVWSTILIDLALATASVFD